ncbi:MAG: MraY family glycosyltransferase [Patescibacteria group bacterium]|nr:MraY family glycosyltransferase [Patescibacteria group bacterium]
MNYIYLLTLLIAVLSSIILTPIVKQLAIKKNIVDLPNPRKIHSRPTPLLGGLAIFGSFFISIYLILTLAGIYDSRVSSWQLFAIFIGGIIIMLGGYFDDKFNLKPSTQIIFPVISSIIIVMSGIRINYVTNPGGGIYHFSVMFGSMMAFIWLLGMSYTTKFLDGLDGLLSGVTFIGSIIIFFVSLRWDLPLSLTSIMCMALAGSTLGFLFFNWHPAKIFLGEGGSIFCGFMLGVLAIISGSKIATALLIMGVPILDVLWVIARRLFEKKSPTASDRKHLHFRLIDVGLSHRQTVIFLYFITAIFGITSLFLHSKGKIYALAMLTIFMVLLALVLVWSYRKKNAKI